MFGNVVKTLFAKMMSSHYYKASQFEKLQDALKKARRVHGSSCLFARLISCICARCTHRNRLPP